jgi:hypothetical protein
MKKLLYSSVVLLLFSFSIILFQVSCQKEADAKNENNTSVQNKFIYTVLIPGTNNWQYWTANIDGGNHQPITISLPSGQTLSYSCKLTPDAQKIIFLAWGGASKYYIYSASINGSNVTLLRELTAQQVEINDTY